MTQKALSKADTDRIVSDVRNLYEHLLGGGFADFARTPSQVIHDVKHCTVRRYNPIGKPRRNALPLLLVPPLSAPATSMDLRKGCSVAEYFVSQHRPTYLVDYGDVSTRTDADLGLEYWIEGIVPQAIRVVAADAAVGVTPRPMHLLGWSLGGIMAIFTQAADSTQPIADVAMIGSPFDFSKLQLFQPVRLAAEVTGGRITPQLFRLFGGIPGQLSTLGFRFADPMRLMEKPKFVLSKLDQPQVLAQIEAVDAMMDTMEAYPGASISQMFDQFITKNTIAEGVLDLDGHAVSLQNVSVPVMNIRGDADEVFGPEAACYHVKQLVPNSPRVVLQTAHGGHMGVLTGSSARTETWPAIDAFFKKTDRELARGR